MGEDIQRKIGNRMIIFAWLLFLGLITLSFNHYLNSNQNQLSSINSTEDTVTLKRNRYNHYVATALVNGVAMNALLDTGASYVSIPGKIAKRLKLKSGIRYKVTTANGDVTVYDTVLDSIQIEKIRQTNVRASINPNMDGDAILLGMNFLKKLELIQRDDELTLRQY